MKKVLVVAVCLMGLMLAGVASAATLNLVSGPNQAKTEITTNRTIADYAMALKDLVGADSVGKEILYPERNELKYLYLPIYKNGKVVGYGTWANTLIYQHPEDIIAVINPDGSLQKWFPLDANDHHPEMKDENYIGKFYGMTKDRDFVTKVDVIAGSTISSNVFFAELKNMLFIFDKYITPQINK